MKTEISIAVSGFWFVLWLFIFFWGQNGWYRIDCALGQKPACDLIAMEYTKKAQP